MKECLPTPPTEVTPTKGTQGWGGRWPRPTRWVLHPSRTRPLPIHALARGLLVLWDWAGARSRSSSGALGVCLHPLAGGQSPPLLRSRLSCGAPPSPHNPIAPSRGPGPHVPPHNPADPLQTRRVREGCRTTSSHLGSPPEPQGTGRALLWSAVLPQPSHLSDSAWKPPTWFLPADPGAFSPWCRVLDLPEDGPVLGVGTCPVFDK